MNERVVVMVVGAETCDLIAEANMRSQCGYGYVAIWAPLGPGPSGRPAEPR